MSAAQIAQWMFDKLQQQKSLKQSSVASQIRTQWGEQYVFKNRQRNWGINKDILDEFRKLTPDNVVWSRSRQTWRYRGPGDPPGRMVR
jgi:hypothetical protein